MRLIDADALREPLMAFDSKVLDIIDNAPTIEPAPIIEEPVYLDTEEVTKMVIEKLAGQGHWEAVKHGQWLSTDTNACECSVCHTWEPFHFYEWKYCPHCGARMDGDDNETD